MGDQAGFSSSNPSSNCHGFDPGFRIWPPSRMTLFRNAAGLARRATASQSCRRFYRERTRERKPGRLVRLEQIGDQSAGFRRGGTQPGDRRFEL